MFFYVIFQLFGNILITIISGGLPIIMMMDHEKIKEGVRLMLEGIGVDIHREGLLDTPDRIARMCEQIYGGLYENAATHLSKQFHATNNNIVLEKDITFYSTCEHHLLPFYGKAHVAYIPDQRVAGLSKLARTVEVFARRPQIQENLTAQIADALEEYLQPKVLRQTLPDAWRPEAWQ